MQLSCAFLSHLAAAVQFVLLRTCIGVLVGSNKSSWEGLPEVKNFEDGTSGCCWLWNIYQNTGQMT